MAWYTWIHHDTPIEWSDHIQERWEFIRKHKPANEIETRLRCIVEVPSERVPEALRTAGTAYNQAQTAYDQAETAYDQARGAHAPTLLALALELVPDAPCRGSSLVFTK